eukprot:Phypoly_transcript_10821.p1 GENE.Phypoly_transcript_10821~~Phypoly_transcript_10821.p1  ORF type:complete len:373 (+),score=42.54 Phypoly_transcript_10821:106-1224(+)
MPLRNQREKSFYFRCDSLRRIEPNIHEIELQIVAFRVQMGNSLSQDLVEYVPGHLALLYHVDRLPELTSNPEFIGSAIKRYKNFMFLRSYDLAQHTSVEVEWMWHVHRLHPRHYQKDCERAFGRTIPSQYKPMNPQKDHLHLVEHFDFHCNATKELPKGIQDAIDNFYPSFDLVAAAIRQRGFIAQSRAFFGCTRKDFKKFEKDYVMYLELVSECNPRDTLVPTIAIDLMWHTHMRIPEQYFIDSRNLLGRLLDHDDNIESSKISESFQRTSDLWRKKFGKQYALPGTPIPLPPSSSSSTSSSTPSPSKSTRPITKTTPFADGTLFAIGAWGYYGYHGSCANSMWEWDGLPGVDAGNMSACGASVCSNAKTG